METKFYICIDLKTFYASVECVERGLDPFKTNLVVADQSRGIGAICLAISPKMKAQGVRNRCRIFEIPKDIKYITAIPRMGLYIKYSANIYAIYLKYIAKDDIHVYSIDEAFMDVTRYLKMYKMTVNELARVILDDIYKTTGISATAGIGTNLYLAKIALDIISKKSPDGIGFLDEELYQKTLWHHQPLTDFWQVGKGISTRLANMNIFNMYDVAHFPEERLYKEFGINAEYLIDHAWGKESCTIDQIKAYKSQSNSLSNSQILFEDYDYSKAYLVMKEMVELLCLTMTEKHLVTNSLFLGIGYSKDVIKPTRGSVKMTVTTNTFSIILTYYAQLFEKVVNKKRPIRRISIGFNNVIDEIHEQYDLFTDLKKVEKDKKIQTTINTIKQKHGKNAILKGMNLEEGATTTKRNKLIGGHNEGE